MAPTFSDDPEPDGSVLTTEAGRQRLVQTALRITENTALAPGGYERRLLAQFVRGELTIDQVLARLDAEPAAR